MFVVSLEKSEIEKRIAIRRIGHLIVILSVNI